MASHNQRGAQEQIDDHSLPGTHQAGKGPSACEPDDQKNPSRSDQAQKSDKIEKHSLPGTNQAGKPILPNEQT